MEVEYHKLISTAAFHFNLRRYSTGTYSHVFTALNMWQPGTGTDPYEYQFKVYRWDGAAGTLASGTAGAASYTYLRSGGWILDVMVGQCRLTLSNPS
jgi:hypothetical protein